ncbi:MAG: dockerin type I domain-containing protein [Candidatus Hydrogenedentota bacterium]
MMQRFGRVTMACACAAFVLGASLIAAPARADAPERVEPARVYGLVGSNVSAVAFSPVENRILLGGSHGALLDSSTGEVVTRFIGHSVSDASFSGDGKRLLTYSAEAQEARLWDTETWEHLLTIGGGGGTDRVYSAALSKDGRYMLAGMLSKARLIDANTGDTLHTYVYEYEYYGVSGVNDVAFCPEGRIALTSGRDVRLWDTETGEMIRNDEHHARSLAVSPDGERYIAGTDFGFAGVWDMETGERVQGFSKHSDLPRGVHSVAFSPDGRHALSGGGGTYIWDIETGEVIHDLGRRSVVFSPDGSRLLAGSGGGTPRLLDAATAEEIARFEGPAGGSQHDGPMAVSPDGATVASRSSDTEVWMWDIASGERLRTLEWDTGTGAGLRDMAFSSCGERLLLGWTFSRTWLVDAETGELLQVYSDDAVDSDVRAVDFSSDDLRVLTAQGSQVHLWDAESGERLRVFEDVESDHSVTSVAFSPDDDYVLTGSTDGAARLWHTETGSLIRTFEGHEGVIKSVAFSHDGQRIVTGASALTASGNDTARLWDTETGEHLHTLQGHESLRSSGVSTRTVESVAFSPDNQLVLTGSQDRTARLWDTDTGEALRVLRGHNTWVKSMAFTPSGDEILTRGRDGLVFLWEVDDELRRAYGDVTGDGEVNAKDIQVVINAILGLEVDPLHRPDVRGNKTVDARDLQAVINVVLGIEE